MDHQELRELTGAYALGILGRDERRALEAHLATCPECAGEVRQAIEATRALPFAVEQVAPPAALRGRVLEAARQERAAHKTASPGRLRRRMLLPIWAAAASAAAVGLAVYAVSLRGRIEALEDRVRAAEAVTARLQTRLASVQTESDAARRSAAVLASRDVRRVDLEAKSPAPGTVASAFWSPSRGLVFAATGLPALPSGRVYQLWFVLDTAPVSAGLMTPDASGLATAVAAPPAGITKVVAIAVTLEPAGGVAAPTTQPILVGTL